MDHSSFEAVFSASENPAGPHQGPHQVGPDRVGAARSTGF
jgi:hypothetical protein